MLRAAKFKTARGALVVVAAAAMIVLFLQGLEAHSALCTFRADLKTRADAARELLRDHPDGFAGIPASVIRESIRNQQRTIDSLHLHLCSKGG